MSELVDRLQLTEKEIDVGRSSVLFSDNITCENIDLFFETHNSQWSVEDGWLTGLNPDESAGMAVMKQDFPGNIMLEFEGRTKLPSTHDINFMWNGEWSDELNICRNAYIGSICGWHNQLAGIEKSPDYKFRVTVPNNNFEPGRTYKVRAGSIDGTCFLLIDSMLVLEANDPEPLNNKIYTKIGFTAWSSHIQIRNILIRRINWKPVEKIYIPEF